MKKLAKEMEADFKSQGFTYQYKFEANNAVYYVDQGGKMGVVYRGNPTELQFVDLSGTTLDPLPGRKAQGAPLL